MKRLIIFINLLLVSSFALSQETLKNSGSIIGTVTSSMGQKPLPGITITLVNTKLGTFSKSDGKYILRNIPSGVYSLKFTGVGFESYVQTDVAVNPSKSTELNVELVEKVIELQGAEVRASYFVKKVESLTSTQTLNAEDIRRTPGVQEDVIRATALLPGVAVTSAGRNDLIVRGGAPFENLFIVDNIEIPNINHFGSQGSSGGPLSIINIDYVKNVSFSAGGFGAKFGDKASSLTNITLRNGNEDKFGGKLVLSATGFGANLEGPIEDIGSYWISVRRSYLDFIFKAAGFGFIPQYWDFAGKINLKLTKNDYLNFLTIGALDDVALNNEEADKRYSNSRVAVPDQKQYFSGLTWKHLFESGFSTVTLGQTYTKFNTAQYDSNLTTVFLNNSLEPETSLKTDFDWQFGSKIGLTFGNQAKFSSNLKYNISIPGYMRRNQFGDTVGLYTDTSLNVYKNSTYASLTAGLGHHKVTVGGRYDYFGYLELKSYFSPRLSVIYQINDVSALIFSAGRYYQSPSYVWLVGDRKQNLKPIKADQVVLGYEHTPMEDLKVQLEVFYKVYDNYPARVYRPQAVLSPSGFDDISSDIPFGLEPLSSVATGFSQGAELFIQKKMGDIPLYGLLSLSLSQSKFRSIEGIERNSAFDSRFIMNLAMGYRFSDNWEISGKFRLSTGLPTTPYFLTSDTAKGIIAGTKDFSKYNEGDRYPLFHALDLRIDKRWNLGAYNLTTYIDIQNVYNRINVSSQIWNQRTQSVEFQKSIGILPSIGISFEF